MTELPYSKSEANGDDVRRPSAAVSRMAATWLLIDDVMGGTASMRAAGRRRLPQWPAEDDRDYANRLAVATMFPAYARTISVLTGKPFSKAIAIGENVPPRIAEWLNDADADGRNLDAFAACVCMDALAYGLSGILVDAPPSRGARTIADEREAGVRPYLVHVRHDAILGWRSERVGASTRLTQLRLLETVEEPDGAYGVKLIEQVRVLTPGRWEIHRKIKTEDGGEAWALRDEGESSIKDEIPFVPVHGFRESFMVGRPPMLDLAHLNVEHWQSKSDQQTILHVARVPILFARDIGGDDKLPIGAGALIRADGANADMRYVEHGGAAIAAGRESLLDVEDQMRQVGAELLIVKPGNITEVQTRADNEPGTCDLQRIVMSLEDALDRALYLMARYVGEESGGNVSIYSDFGVATLAEASAQLLAGMQADGSLSHATLLGELKRRGVLSADVDVTAEIEAAATERAATLAAAAARERAMLAMGRDDGTD